VAALVRQQFKLHYDITKPKKIAAQNAVAFEALRYLEELKPDLKQLQTGERCWYTVVTLMSH
jgi:hypothetical protein